MRLDNPMADGKSQAGSLAHVLGGEERVEDPPQVRFRNAAAGIDDRYCHHRPILGSRRARVLGAAGGHGDAALFLDRVLGVDQHVHDHLLDLVGVDPDRRQRAVEVDVDLDIAQMRGPLDDSHRIIDDLVEVGEFLLRLLLAGEIEQPLDDGGAALGFTDDQVHVLGVGTLVRHFLPQQMREGENAGERIVQFVGDAGGEQADRGELLAAHGFGLRAAQFLRAAFHSLLERVPPFAQLLARFAQGVGHAVEHGGKLAEFIVAAHRDRLVQIAGRQPLRAAFEIAQRQIDQAVHEEADRQRGNQDECQGNAGDPGRAGAQASIDVLQRIDDVEHAEDGGLLRVLMAGGIVAGRFVADDFRAAQKRLAVGALERPGPVAADQLPDRRLVLIAVHAGVGAAASRQPDFGRVGREDDRPVIAEHPDAGDFALIGHIMDDAVDIGRLVLQHREARALADHLGELRDVIGNFADDLIVQKPGDQPGERQHGRGQRDREVEHDLEFQGLRLHAHCPIRRRKWAILRFRPPAVQPGGGVWRPAKYTVAAEMAFDTYQTVIFRSRRPEIQACGTTRSAIIQ